MKIFDHTSKTNWQYVAIVLGIEILAVGGILLLRGFEQRSLMPQPQTQDIIPPQVRKSFATQEECERQIGYRCKFVNCDINCPSGFQKGWSATNVKIEQVLDTGDWQTYRNEEFGFEVKYPKEWKVTKLYDGTIDFSPDPEKSQLSAVGNFIRVKSIPLENAKTPQKTMIENTFLGESDLNPESFAVFKERKLGDNSFFYIHNYLSGGQHGGIYYIADDSRLLMFNFIAYIDMDIFTGEKSFTATQTEKDAAIEDGTVHLITKQILATFRFVNVQKPELLAAGSCAELKNLLKENSLMNSIHPLLTEGLESLEVAYKGCRNGEDQMDNVSLYRMDDLTGNNQHELLIEVTQSSATTVYSSIGIFEAREGTYAKLLDLDIGRGGQVIVENGQLAIRNIAVYSDGDPMCCSSRIQHIYYKFSGEKFVIDRLLQEENKD